MYGLKDRFDRWVSMNGGFTRDMVNVRKFNTKKEASAHRKANLLVEYHPTLIKENKDGADK